MQYNIAKPCLPSFREPRKLCRCAIGFFPRRHFPLPPVSPSGGLGWLRGALPEAVRDSLPSGGDRAPYHLEKLLGIIANSINPKACLLQLPLFIFVILMPGGLVQQEWLC